jgi:S1-C subfamily serine protease
VKKFSIGLIFGALLMLSVNAFAAVMLNEIPFVLYIDDVKIEKPLYADANGTTYAPLWEISEKFGIDARLKGNDIYMATPKTDTEAVAEKCKDSCVMVYAYTKTHQKQGSGFVYNGYVITAKHVVDGANRIEIYTNDSSTKKTGTIVTTNEPFDVAVIKADIDKPSVVLGDSNTLQEGHKLIAISSPKAKKNTIDYCVFKEIGSISGNANYVVTESEMTSGSSGGAIFNENGEVVCVIHGDLEGANETATVPINRVKIILNDLK